MTPDSRTMGNYSRAENGSIGVIESTQSVPSPPGTYQTTLAGPDTEAPSIDEHRQRATRTTRKVNAFSLGDTVFIRHYFESDEVFALLSPYYNEREFRFEIPSTEFESLCAAALTHGYQFTVVEDVARFAVVVKKYRSHPEEVFSESVAQFSADGYNVFVMKDKTSVETVLDDGAIHLSDVPITVRFPPGYGTGPLTVRDVS